MFFFHTTFSVGFKQIMVKAFEEETNRRKYWEDIYIDHLAELPKIRINKFRDGVIKEFDSLEELRLFDKKYEQSGSVILKYITDALGCKESDIHCIAQVNNGLLHAFSFELNPNAESVKYLYYEKEGNNFLETIS